MNQLQEVIASNWTRIEGERAQRETKLYWRARLADGDWVPTREILNLLAEWIEAIKASHERLWPEPQSYPFYQLATYAERWLAANRLKLQRLIGAEGER